PAAGGVEPPASALSAPGGRALVATSVLAMLLLFVATALALRDVIAMHARPANADVAWAGLLMLAAVAGLWPADPWRAWLAGCGPESDRKSTRLNSSHQIISYAVFCLKKKKKNDCNSKTKNRALKNRHAQYAPETQYATF